jgi:hypothetical protein
MVDRFHHDHTVLYVARRDNVCPDVVYPPLVFAKVMVCVSPELKTNILYPDTIVTEEDAVCGRKIEDIVVGLPAIFTTPLWDIAKFPLHIVVVDFDTHPS